MRNGQCVRYGRISDIAYLGRENHDCIGLRFYCASDDRGGGAHFEVGGDCQNGQRQEDVDLGILILIALIAVPLLLLGVIVKFAQYSSVAGVFESLGGSDN